MSIPVVMPQMGESIAEGTIVRWIKKVGDAVDRDELRLLYQPQFGCSDDEVVGAEALVRWHNPERGMVPPSEFIEAAEESGGAKASAAAAPMVWVAPPSGRPSRSKPPGRAPVGSTSPTSWSASTASRPTSGRGCSTASRCSAREAATRPRQRPGRSDPSTVRRGRPLRLAAR